MPTQRDKVWSQTMALLLEESKPEVDVAVVRERLDTELDDPPSRKIVYEVFRSMEDLGLVESDDTIDQDPTTSKVVTLSDSFRSPAT